MKDEFNEYAPDPTSQKSVTDWLMKVISTKKPEDLHSSDAAEEAPRNGSSAHRAETSHGGVAVAEMPHEEQPRVIVETRTRVVFDEVSLDDLCGPLTMPAPPPPPAPKKDEITADDLCGPLVTRPVAVAPAEIAPPVFEMPPAVAATDILRDSVINAAEPVAQVFIPEVPVVAAPQRDVTAQDISRDSVLNAVEYSHSAAAAPAPEAVAAVDHDITAADITRDSVLRSIEPEASAAVMEPPAQVAPVEPEAATFVVQPPVYQPEPVAEVRAVEEVKLPEPVAEVAPAQVTASETDVFGHQQSVDDFFAQPHDHEVAAGIAAVEALLEEERLANASTEASAHSAEATTAESVFAREGIWGETARPAPAVSEDVFREPKRRFMEGEGQPDMASARPEGWTTAWKTLLRLGSVLPWIARALPAIEAGTGVEDTGLTQHVRHEVASLRLLQHEIRTTVQDHSLQLKRMEEQLTRVRVSVESDSLESAGLADSVKSAMKLVRMVGIGGGALLLILILMVGLVLARGH